MKNMNLIIVITLFVLTACATLKPYSHAIASLIEVVEFPDNFIDKEIQSAGILFLYFENNYVCVDESKNKCINYATIPAMEIYREAYNRNFVKFSGALRFVERGWPCAKNCTKPSITMITIQDKDELLNHTQHAQVVDNYLPELIYSENAQDLSELTQLVNDFVSSVISQKHGEGFIESFDELTTKPAGDYSTDRTSRVQWVSKMLNFRLMQLENKPQYFVGRFSDDLDASQPGDDGFICVCLVDTCKKSDINNTNFFDQSLGDATFCLPVILTANKKWKIENWFFSPRSSIQWQH